MKAAAQAFSVRQSVKVRSLGSTETDETAKAGLVHMLQIPLPAEFAEGDIQDVAAAVGVVVVPPFG